MEFVFFCHTGASAMPKLVNSLYFYFLSKNHKKVSSQTESTTST